MIEYITPLCLWHLQWFLRCCPVLCLGFSDEFFDIWFWVLAMNLGGLVLGSSDEFLGSSILGDRIGPTNQKRSSPLFRSVPWWICALFCTSLSCVKPLPEPIIAPNEIMVNTSSELHSDSGQLEWWEDQIAFKDFEPFYYDEEDPED